MYYILKDRIPVPCPNPIEWAKSYETSERVVAKTELEGGVLVSTVFLGIDLNFYGGSPLVFETMIFDATWEQAEAGHEEAVKLATSRSNE